MQRKTEFVSQYFEGCTQPPEIETWDWKTYGFWLGKNESWPSGAIEIEVMNLVLAEKGLKCALSPSFSIFFLVRLR